MAACKPAIRRRPLRFSQLRIVTEFYQHFHGFLPEAGAMPEPADAAARRLELRFFIPSLSPQF
jgi:hypothetical protein